MVLAEVDQRPAEHPATHGEQAEPSCNQKHVAEQRPTAALRHLDETEDRINSQLPETLRRQRCPQWGLIPICVLKCVSWHVQVCVFTSETIVQTSLLANMTVMKIARW